MLLSLTARDLKANTPGYITGGGGAKVTIWPRPLPLHGKRPQNRHVEEFADSKTNHYSGAHPERLTMPSAGWEISPLKVKGADKPQPIQGVTSSRLWENKAAALIWRTAGAERRWCQSESSLLS